MEQYTHPHYWFGQWIDDAQLSKELLQRSLAPRFNQILSLAFPFQDLLQTCQALADDLFQQQKSFTVLHGYLCTQMATAEAQAILVQLIAMLQKETLQDKLLSELGTTQPHVLERRYPERQFETWAPLGCLVHVMPANVFAVAAMGLLEGLLSNNINMVKVSARDSQFAALFAQELVSHDRSDRLHDYIAVLRLSSKQNDLLQSLFDQADVISAWGGEAAISAIRKMAPDSVRIVAWGHKVSFAYLSHSMLQNQEAIEGFAKDMCVLDQQACSSPQTLFVEGNEQEVLQVAQALNTALTRIAPTIPAEDPDDAAWAEIATVINVATAEQALGLCHVIQEPHQAWRLIVDYRPGLKPSPLYRTLWIKPIQAEQVTSVLRPMRAWLQTCGLAANFNETKVLVRKLFAAGVSRITRPGEMLNSYNGSPHDGLYALQQFMRRITLDASEEFAQLGSFAQLENGAADKMLSKSKIMTKADFLQLMHSQQHTYGLVVRSGGSSGQTAYSHFLWKDYAKQMKETAHGLLAAGLNPKTDVVMNAFAAGYMYGSFISFWTILETLQIRQLPMAMVDDYQLLVDEIIQQQATVLIGMTPHLLGLFNAQGQRIKDYGGLKKVYFGGEGLSRSQRHYIQQCGVDILRSVTYGSNDAGPIGYQCEYCEGGVHHLFSALQRLEIVDLEQDVPVEQGEIGRLILTSQARTSPNLERYEIGDTGRWIDTACACGRSDPLFELVGRMGDVFKAGTPQLNYAQFVQIFSDQANYSGRLQIHLHADGQFNVIEVWMDDSLGMTEDAAAALLLNQYPELSMVQKLGLPVKVQIRIQVEADFVKIKASGKIKHVFDHRQTAVIEQ